MPAHSIDIPYGNYHDAWRSVRMFEPDAPYDERVYLEFFDLPRVDQALCVVTGMTVEDTLIKHVGNGGALDGEFVRQTMETIYDVYNRYTLATRGLQKYGYDWFHIRASDGPLGVIGVPPYESLSFPTKEIDRRMIMVGALAVPAELTTAPGVEQAQKDGIAILTAVKVKKPYECNNGYMVEASYA